MTKKFVMNNVATAAVALMTLFSANSAIAQTTQDNMPKYEAPAKNYDDKKLLQFTIAMDDIAQLRQKYEDKFNDVENADEAQALQEEAQGEMLNAIEAAGLSATEYTSIAQQAQQDEALRKKILNMSNAD
ncbi:DUF4168 domain-containing protein [Alteromonas hispanica]|uniref:DUF4168 domain-containing protein n=1 Tax=Alteromonas hispanica TaxID=315421 RepID=A0A6L9MV83_9ALTE|nr:DUF4168 domain-containing protein [Alteromonas hispanica]NDW22154.1 DUF4168 domain-containing protein [Alteromonas hispanica]